MDKIIDKVLEFKGLISTIILALILTIGLQTVAQICIVDGESMYPTLQNREVFVSLKARWREIDRGDIVAVNAKNLSYVSSNMLVKRVIGIPGDTITVSNGDVYVNDKKIKEDYILDNEDERIIIDELKYTLDDDEYFIMGDNRNNSTDSRFFGPINKENITSIYLFSFLGN